MRVLPLLLLASCASLPRMEVVGYDRGESPKDWAPSIAYYGEWPSYRAHLLCALRHTGPDFRAGLVIEFRHDDTCTYDPAWETIRANSFDCANRMLAVRAVDVLEAAPEPCEEI